MSAFYSSHTLGSNCSCLTDHFFFFNFQLSPIPHWSRALMVLHLQNNISNHQSLRHCYGDAVQRFWLSDVPAGLIMCGLCPAAHVQQTHFSNCPQSLPAKEAPGTCRQAAAPTEWPECLSVCLSVASLLSAEA